jgi:DNA mismatch repair protein MutH
MTQTGRWAGAVLLGAGLLWPAPAAAQDDLRKDIEELKKGQEQILRQLQEMKQLLQAQPQQRPAGANVKDVVFNLGENPRKGSDQAKLTLVEFTDYQ